MVKKVPITPLLLINCKSVMNIHKKVNAYNYFFTDKHLPIPSRSTLPVKMSYLAKNHIHTACLFFICLFF